MDTYCKTYLIAKQTGLPLHFMPEAKLAELLALKRRMGLPDARLAHLPEPAEPGPTSSEELDRIVEQVVARLEGGS
jgi:hypothetical protein